MGVMLLGAGAAWPAPAEHPLLAYVNRPDTTYTWAKEDEQRLLLGGMQTRVRMTSQVWQGIPWKHNLFLFRPDKLRDGSTALLLITGGSGDPGTLQTMALVANTLGMPTAALFDIPNQPLFEGRREDALIAYTLQQYLKSGDKTWPLLFPMTKSAVRAMDTIQQISAKEWQAPIQRFVVTGASKRGWTTWLTGAADKRVAGIIPMVYDNLNIPAQMAQQIAFYGRYSEQIRDYTATGLLDLLLSPAGKQVVEMVDPYVLRDRITMPKLIINGSNDPYWTLESASIYFKDLAGDRHLLYVPNAGHGLGDPLRILGSVGAFTAAVAAGQTLPTLSWEYQERAGGVRLVIKPAGTPKSVTVWTTTMPTRDFREAKWVSEVVPAAADGTFAYTLPAPKAGHAALFGEVRDARAGTEYVQSTLPRVIRGQ